MGKNSAIEWTNHTFNPWWGCTKVSPGCANCYAETFSGRWGFDVWGPTAGRRFFGDKHWSEPLKWNRQARKTGVHQRVFCGSMCDVFEIHPDPTQSEALDRERARLWDLILDTPHLIWMLLTKRPENMLELTPWRRGWPYNVWALASAENQETLERRITHLLNVPAAVHGLSLEPLLGAINLRDEWTGVYREAETVREWLGDSHSCHDRPGKGLRHHDGRKLNWVIVGGESGPKARPMHPDWVRAIKDQCQASDVPFFFKQWGAWLPIAENCDPGAAVGSKRHVVMGGTYQQDVLMSRVGKKRAGRLLDGRTWDQAPEAS